MYLAEAERRGLLAVFYLELTTGLRRGELLALLWTDLDIGAKTISVTKQVNRIKGDLVVSVPKTQNSVRTLAIPQQAVDLLIEEHKRHPDNPYMFPSPKTGTMYDPDAFRRTHDKILKAIGAEHVRFTGTGSSSHPASSVQKIILGDHSIENQTQEDYTLIVKKVDSSNPTKGLAGAQFHIQSENGSFSRDVVTGPDGTYELKSLSANTYAVTETAGPSGYGIDNAGPQYVSLPNNGSNTVTRDCTLSMSGPTTGATRAMRNLPTK